MLYHLGMREVLYKTTQRYYDLDISFIKNINEKGCLFCHLHISQEEVKNMGYAKLGAGGGKQGVLR